MNTLDEPTLDSPGRKKIKYCACGEPNKSGKFVGFKGHEKYGYCHSCDRTFFPPKEGAKVETFIPKPVKPAARPISFIQVNQLKGYVTDPLKSNLAIWLCNQNRATKKQVPFTEEVRAAIIDRYKLMGTDKYANGSAFLYIDAANRIRQIKLMGYNPETGKRIREPKSQIWQPGAKILEDAGEVNPNVVPCFFGEHLLRGNMKEVYIFESEVTAMYASVFFPDVACLATGGKNGCKWTQRPQYSVLIGRKVTFFPDIDAHEEWELKVNALQADGLNATVSNKIIQTAEAFCIKTGQTLESLKDLKFDLRDLLVFKTPPSQSTTSNIFEADNQLVNNKLIRDETKSNTLTETPKREERETIKKEEIHLPEPVEAESETNRWETRDTANAETFDVEEHRKWLKTVPELPRGECIRLTSLRDAHPFDSVFYIKNFVTGRLKSIEAWDNSQRGAGDKALHIRQLRELKNLINHKQSIQ